MGTGMHRGRQPRCKARASTEPRGSCGASRSAQSSRAMQPATPRQREILALARVQGRVSVDGLAEKFSLTPQTIRKDLNDLCGRRLLSRIHGGAVIASDIENIAYEARRLIAADETHVLCVDT
eukprot:Opistho-1_new@98964